MPCLPNTDFATSTASSQGKGIIYHPTFTLRAVGYVVISLESVTVSQGRAPAKVVQEALAWVAANQADLLKEWMKWHR